MLRLAVTTTAPGETSLSFRVAARMGPPGRVGTLLALSLHGWLRTGARHSRPESQLCFSRGTFYNNHLEPSPGRGSDLGARHLTNNSVPVCPLLAPARDRGLALLPWPISGSVINLVTTSFVRIETVSSIKMTPRFSLPPGGSSDAGGAPCQSCVGGLRPLIQWVKIYF